MAEIARKVIPRDFRAIDTTSASIILLEGGPRVLPTYPPDLSEKAREHLVRLGVDVRTDALVTGIEDGAVLVGDQRILTENVYWAAGVAASPLGRSLGTPVDRVGRVMVEADCSIPGRPEVFVIGDLAHLEQDGAPLPGVCQTAMQMGRHAARMILGDLERRQRKPFRYRDKGSLATIGRAAAVADIRGMRISGLPAWLIWVFVHIMYLIGFKNRLVVMIQWAWAYVGYRRGIRLITGEPEFRLTRPRTDIPVDNEEPAREVR
jgi:NADH dehydrogenase